MTNTPTIQFQIRNVYGEEIAYPMCTDAKIFADIAGTKTLTRMTLRRVLALGYVLVEIDRNGNVSRSYGGNDRSANLPAVR
jgi:hypothetical protein